MRSRDPVPILRTFAILLASGLVFATTTRRTAAEASPPGPPNLVIIVTDDQDASVATMPRLRSLIADQGVTFKNSFCPTPLCAPSHASFLTGKYAHNTQI